MGAIQESELEFALDADIRSNMDVGIDGGESQGGCYFRMGGLDGPERIGFARDHQVISKSEFFLKRPLPVFRGLPWHDAVHQGITNGIGRFHPIDKGLVQSVGSGECPEYPDELPAVIGNQFCREDHPSPFGISLEMDVTFMEQGEQFSGITDRWFGMDGIFRHQHNPRFCRIGYHNGYVRISGEGLNGSPFIAGGAYAGDGSVDKGLVHFLTMAIALNDVCEESLLMGKW